MATFKQKMLRFFYPLIRTLGKSGKRGNVRLNTNSTSPVKEFYDLKTTLNSGEPLNLSNYKGQKVLIVNTASDCGYTGQYKELQSLHEKVGGQLAILAFPANDFMEQEKGTDEEISQFCQVNYGVTFPIVQKSVVIKKEGQHPLFQWLTDSSANGWNDHQPDWNFGKYIIDEEGKLIGYYGPSISPLSDDFIRSIES